MCDMCCYMYVTGEGRLSPNHSGAAAAVVRMRYPADQSEPRKPNAALMMEVVRDILAPRLVGGAQLFADPPILSLAQPFLPSPLPYIYSPSLVYYLSFSF